jgi:hypothetical protein
MPARSSGRAAHFPLHAAFPGIWIGCPDSLDGPSRPAGRQRGRSPSGKAIAVAGDAQRVCFEAFSVTPNCRWSVIFLTINLSNSRRRLISSFCAASATFSEQTPLRSE